MHAQSRNPRGRTLAVAVFILTAAPGCGFGYGKLEDHSEFTSAQLTEDKHVLFAFHDFKYRPAAGWRAFPDGGIPDYVVDENTLGLFDVQSHTIKILRHEKNKVWQPGAGTFTIHSLRGNVALIAQGGQLRGPFAHGFKHVLADLDRGELRDLDLKSDFASRGRDTGQIYLVDPPGTLVFITLSLAEAKDPSAYRDRDLVPEIWVRTPEGEYVKAANSAHYEETANGDVIYWEPSTREFMAFSIANRAVRKLPGYRVHEYHDVTEGVILSSDHKGLEIGTKVAGEWRYTALPLTPAMLR